jgi:hypothetical protein
VEGGVEGGIRRARIRIGDGGNVRVAVAEVSRD